MNLTNTFKMAIKSIMSNKVRTALTMLGIIIGVVSVVVMVGVGQGSNAEVTQRIENLGANLINVIIRGRGVRMEYDDVGNIEEIEGVSKVSPSIMVSGSIIYNQIEDEDSDIRGVNEYYTEINNYSIANGRNLSPIDSDFRLSVAVLGAKTAKTLFGETDPIGEKISIAGRKYKVIGVLEEKPETTRMASNEMVILPAFTVVKQFRQSGITALTISAENADSSPVVVERVTAYLTELLKTDTGVRVMSQEDVLSTLNEVTSQLTIMLAGIAAISLVVGEIGIMNIMLVTVTERTREIGIRKAIGAKRRDILSQFLIESAFISCMGGIVGILLSVVIIGFVNKMTDITAVFNIFVMGTAFLFALAVGVFFGMYPAVKASKLKPVDALRYE